MDKTKEKRIIKAKLAELEAKNKLDNELGISGNMQKDFCVPGDISINKAIKNLKKLLGQKK